MPRPCLKHPHPHPHPISSSSSPPSPRVHFPPSPTIASTHATHSPSVYDRAPITVAPNVCALPERGGRIYLPIPVPVPPPPLPLPGPPPPRINININIHNLALASSNAEPPGGVPLILPSVATAAAVAAAHFALPANARACASRAENAETTISRRPRAGLGGITNIEASAASPSAAALTSSSPPPVAVGRGTLSDSVISDDGCLGGF